MSAVPAHGERVAADTLRFVRRLPGPIENVWEYLVDPEKRGLWLASGPTEPRVGGKIELHFQHRNLTPVVEPVPERWKSVENGHIARETITRYEPPYVFAFTWATEGTPSEVTFELSEEGKDVLLVLTHRRLDDRAELIGTAGGWHTHLDILADRLHGRTPGPFWSAALRHDEYYEKRFV